MPVNSSSQHTHYSPGSKAAAQLKAKALPLLDNRESPTRLPNSITGLSHVQMNGNSLHDYRILKPPSSPFHRGTLQLMWPNLKGRPNRGSTHGWGAPGPVPANGDEPSAATPMATALTDQNTAATPTRENTPTVHGAAAGQPEAPDVDTTETAGGEAISAAEVAGRFFRRAGWDQSDIQIIGHQITPQNCHQYVFGDGRGEPEQVQAYLERRKYQHSVLICTDGDMNILHSAKPFRRRGRFIQKLPGLPVFTSGRATLKKRYKHTYLLPKERGRYSRHIKKHIAKVKIISELRTLYDRFFQSSRESDLGNRVSIVIQKDTDELELNHLRILLKRFKKNLQATERKE